MIIENYQPDYYLEAVYQLDHENLKRLDISLLLVDLDNTLIAWNHPDGTPELRAWVDEMKENGIQICVVSNNHYKRVQRAVAPFDIDFINDAMKPFTRGIRRALDRYQTKPEKALMVGDQRMTDIRASKRAGVRSVLVKPLLESDHWQTQFNRWRERRVTKKIEDKYGRTEYRKSIG